MLWPDDCTIAAIVDDKFAQLKTQIEKIADLKNAPNWGPEFQLWEDETTRFILANFGDTAARLFTPQETIVTSYIDDGFNDEQYAAELQKRKTILESLLQNVREYQPSHNVSPGNEVAILKELWRKEEALKENLLKTAEAELLVGALIKHLENTLPPDSIPGLRFRKLMSTPFTWWTDSNGYPVGNPWKRITPFLELLEQHEAEKTIKKRLETGDIFVESRSQGEDQHLLIGKRDGSGEKAHVIIDGKNGEIRVEDRGKTPEDLSVKIEAVMTLPDGRRIRSTRELLELLP